MYDVLAETRQAIDEFVVPKRYRRQGALEESFTYRDIVCNSIAPALGIQGGFVGSHPAKTMLVLYKL